MPLGLVIMKLDARAGFKVLSNYPEDLVIDNITLMHVYTTHEYSAEAGLVSLSVGSLNIASYYTGPDKGYYILLLLTLEEDPDAYEGGLIDISRIILQNLVDNAYLPMVPTLFRRLSVYPKLNNEQRLAITYQDEIKRLIIKQLNEECVISKSELTIWLKDQSKEWFIDVEGMLTELVKREIIKQTSVKGMSSELIFLTKDIIASRTPPIGILDDPESHGLPSPLVDGYLLQVKEFFLNYRPTEADNLSIVELLINPQVYNTLRLLRTAVVTRNELEKLRKKGVDDIDDVLKMLWDNKLVQVFQTKNRIDYYALISDFYLDTLFPKYTLNTIKKMYEQKSKSEKVLVEYLTVLENTYVDNKVMLQIQKKNKEVLIE